MSDWQVGDLAVCVEGCKLEHDATSNPHYGATAVVSGVMSIGAGWHPSIKGLRRVLSFVGHEGVYCAGCFRKISPDEREACEPEFVTLLKRSKRKVEA